MFVRRQIRPGVFFDADAGGGGGFDSIDALAAATDPANPANAGGGVPAPPAAVPQPPAAAPPAAPAPSGLPDPSAIPDDLLYKDAKELRDEVARARTKWSPFERSLGSLDDQARQTLLDAAPQLGADAARVMQAFASMDPNDRAVMVDLAGQLAPGGDKAAIAAKFADIATYLETGAVPGGDPDPGGFDPSGDDGDDDEDLPVTRAEMAAYLAQEREQQAIAYQTQVILSEARELGYDLTSTDPADAIRNAAFEAALRNTPDGDLAKAHATVTAYEQRIRDDYSNGKVADATRPGTPAGTGVSPTQEQPVQSLDDAAAAMDARLDAALGPRPVR